MLPRVANPASVPPPPSTPATRRAAALARKRPPPASPAELRRLRARLGVARRAVRDAAAAPRFDPLEALDAARELAATAPSRAMRREYEADARMLVAIAAAVDHGRNVLLMFYARRVERLGRFVVQMEGTLARATRCGARTRSGGTCCAPRVHGAKRCKLHGGASTGPRTSEGRARALAALAAVNAKRRAGARVQHQQQHDVGG